MEREAVEGKNTVLACSIHFFFGVIVVCNFLKNAGYARPS